MLDLDKLIDACNQALEDSEDGFTNSLSFFELADPRAVLELARMVEANKATDEVDRLICLIRDLSACLRSIPDAMYPSLQRDKKEMLNRADCVLAIYTS